MPLCQGTRWSKTIRCVMCVVVEDAPEANNIRRGHAEQDAGQKPREPEGDGAIGLVSLSR